MNVTPFALLIVLASMSCFSPPDGSRPGDESATIQRQGLGPNGRFPHPQLQEVAFDGERRLSPLRSSLEPWTWTFTVPSSSCLQGGVAFLNGQQKKAPALKILLHRGLTSIEPKLETEISSSGWVDFSLDLNHWAGETITLEFGVSSREGIEAQTLVWAPLRIQRQAEKSSQRPNLLWIVVDTLRADRLQSYGSSRNTAPEIENLLVRRGVRVSHAIAPAPWTVPTVAGLFTGRAPGEVLAEEVSAHAIPVTVPTLAEVLQDQGYETAGFFANITLRETVGIDRGFETTYHVPWSLDSMSLEASVLQSKAQRFLERRDPARPYFLYLHFIDPHDPYLPPQRGRHIGSPWFPDYRGVFNGDWVHGLFEGSLKLNSPEDQRHLEALYDSEISWVDRAIGQVLRRLDRNEWANTLVALTADHGEEFLDHGGWKHGRTLYEEQLHVPLVLRFDGRFNAGSKYGSPLSIVDLPATLLEGLGIQTSFGNRQSFWNQLRGQGGTPQPVISRRHQEAPLLVSVRLGDQKLVLFDRWAPELEAGKLQTLMLRRERSSILEVELYNLGSDPGEKKNLALESRETVRRLSGLVHRQLGREIPGLRIMARDLPEGAKLNVELRLPGPPLPWRSYFRGPKDHVEWEGDRLNLVFSGENRDQGLLIPVPFPSLEVLKVELDGKPLPRERQWWAGHAPREELSEPDLTTAEWPKDPGVQLMAWIPKEIRVEKSSTVNPEAEAALRAMGYVD